MSMGAHKLELRVPGLVWLGAILQGDGRHSFYQRNGDTFEGASGGGDRVLSAPALPHADSARLPPVRGVLTVLLKDNGAGRPGGQLQSAGHHREAGYDPAGLTQGLGVSFNQQGFSVKRG
eukprot:CAMPEP_0197575844 /NCGR_PEP_ID=MMETSP1326-20131121/1086_1 /TAXON_ID=1155430 /ORGANISM="Genus nov. species nov., Strain RCC2288" /LENGTH=119 /DNA_ID=CAMNT_0043138671 /DNA_START=179 /DNA_END=539 /DNA_ORIENTATION=+